MTVMIPWSIAPTYSLIACPLPLPTTSILGYFGKNDACVIMCHMCFHHFALAVLTVHTHHSLLTLFWLTTLTTLTLNWSEQWQLEVVSIECSERAARAEYWSETESSVSGKPLTTCCTLLCSYHSHHSHWSLLTAHTTLSSYFSSHFFALTAPALPLTLLSSHCRERTRNQAPKPAVPMEDGGAHGPLMSTHWTGVQNQPSTKE